MLLLSSILCLEFWSVNHTLICENSKLNLLKNINFLGEIFSNWPNDFLRINAYKKLLLTIIQWTNTTLVISKLGSFSPFLSSVIFLIAYKYFHRLKPRDNILLLL